MSKSEEKKDRYVKIPILGISGLKLRDFGYIVFRNVFLLINGVIFSVVALLFIFGDRQAGLFLGIISLINMILGLIQDTNAWLALEKLQLLTAPRVTRVKADGSIESVLVENIKKNDRIKLKIGDQVPTDSRLVEGHSFEINEGLITGESDSLPRSNGDRLLAGSVVTSGTGIIETMSVFHESRIARMTEGIKRYSINLSPIQKSINVIVKYAGYLLIAVIAFVVARGLVLDETKIQIVNNIGALANVLVPAGLIFTATLLFSYGAAHLFRRQILLQEVNATEKLGRIKNLCLDKTGTLTENVLTVENMLVPPGSTENFAKEMTDAYIVGTGESSQTMEAIKKFINGNPFKGEAADALAFSSWRQYGAVRVKDGNNETAIYVGSPDIFFPHLKNNQEKAWLESLADRYARQGKRVLCVTRSEDGTAISDNLARAALSIIAVFVFYNNLRAGIRDTIDFFQNRGIRIRIISGDNPATVRTVAALAGINDTDKIISGPEMADWSQADFNERVDAYAIFARIVPEQKEKIIEAFKNSGFTAMVGDGANDALAIKKADLGIAMYDGAPAVRQLASVVLMNNSFAALPAGVELADNVIKNIELFSSLYLNAAFSGFFFFVAISLGGYGFPLTPLNMSFINYITIGLPASLITYWVVLPSGKARPADPQSFLKKILPYTVSSAFIQAAVLTIIFLLGPADIKAAESNTLILLLFIILSYIFFIFTPKVYIGKTARSQKIQLALLGLGIFLSVTLTICLPAAGAFFNIAKPVFSPADLIKTVIALGLSGYAIYRLAGWFELKNDKISA